ncbi:MAG TPA: hypothetical protein VNU23_04155 [Candidatus Cybelea sp.]|jgi:serine phosphatase RsbU (regulator of sigma subunit)|nr:hypothetical protein [Candidatus Cybelea sp.]
MGSATPPRQAFRRHGGQPSPSLISLIVEDIHQFNPRAQPDDITLIVAYCREDRAPA